MARDRHINAAGGFLRAMRDSSRPGGQALGASPLPVKELLLLLAKGALTADQIARELPAEDQVVARAIENLRGLGLLEIESRGEGDLAALTGLGREVAQQQSGG